jgi:O-6-methylguanine DNA methyltransferase
MSKSEIIEDTIKNRIMQEVCKIQFGRTVSYSELAEKAGFKRKERYISKFLKENLYLIAVPCHRVIRKNGEYGDYILGRDFKKYLLEWEKSIILR